MNSLPYVMSKMLRHFFAAANISAIGIRQITAQQRQRQTMAAELVTGTVQFRLVSIYAQRSEQFRTRIAGKFFQLTARG